MAAKGTSKALPEQEQVAAVFLRPFQFRNGNPKACTTHTHGAAENHIKVIGT